MRWHRRRLTSRDRLNIRVALRIQVEQCIANVRDAESELGVETWSREAAGYITAHRNLAASRGTRALSDVMSELWARDLASAMTAALTRADPP